MSLVAAALSFAYHPGTPVLREVSASFEPGTLTAILGPNGSGKTTLLRLLLGLLTPHAGSVTIDARPVHAMHEPERAARLAYVPQRAAVAFGFSVLEVVAMGCGPRVPASRARRAAIEALDAVGLGERRLEPFSELSTGQQQRAVLARALAHIASMPPSPPPALLADEPTGAMDPRHALEAMSLLRAQAAAGRIVVAVLHDLTSALRFADRAILLDRSGSVAAAGPVGEALSAPTIRRVFDIDLLELTDAATGLRVVVPALPGPRR